MVYSQRPAGDQAEGLSHYLKARTAFLKHVESYQCHDASGERRPFILVDSLTRHLTDPHRKYPSCSRNNELEELRVHSFYGSASPPALEREHLLASSVLLRLFYILLALDHPEHITKFLSRNELQRLPLARAELERVRWSNNSSESQNFVDKFLPEQWRWCAHVIELGDGHITDNLILPFTDKTEIRHGGEATTQHTRLFTVQVPEDYVGPELRETLSESQLRAADGTSKGYYRFAFKEFSPEAIGEFGKEKKAWRGLKDKQGVVQYVGWYQWDPKAPPDRGVSDQRTKTSGILLESAYEDLAGTFKWELAPVSTAGIHAMWESIADVAHALRDVHQATIDGTKYIVSHNDIHPGNILRVRSGYKLADVCEAKFWPDSEFPDPGRMELAGGGQSYASPEKSRRWQGDTITMDILQKGDVWALGCVLSEAATWLVLGTEGVRRYRMIRGHQSERKRDDFHDGYKVKRVVTEWHHYLRSACRHSDPYTRRVLDIVDNSMLVEHDRRSDSKMISKELDKLTSPAVGCPVVRHVETLLHSIDPAARRGSHAGMAIESGGPPPLHSRVGQDGMQVSRQSELLSIECKILQCQGPADPEDDGRTVQGLPIQLPESPAELQSQWQPMQSSPTALEDDLESRQVPDLPNLNLFQAESRLEATEGRSRRRGLPSLSWFNSRTPQEPPGSEDHELLLRNYLNNRDIVFLVDNSGTMHDHWAEAIKVLEILVGMVIKYDDDGLELYFTSTDTLGDGKVKAKPKQTREAFAKAMRLADPRQPSNTHPTLALEGILWRFRIAHNSKQSRKKPLTVYYLTDGVWGKQSHEREFDDYLVHFLQTEMNRQAAEQGMTGSVSGVNGVPDRPFSLQFISFGNDPDGLGRLDRLDTQLQCRGVPDVINVTRSGSSVYRMLLASLEPKYDSKGEASRNDGDFGVQGLSSPVSPDEGLYQRYSAFGSRQVDHGLPGFPQQPSFASPSGPPSPTNEVLGRGPSVSQRSQFSGGPPAYDYPREGLPQRGSSERSTRNRYRPRSPTRASNSTLLTAPSELSARTSATSISPSQPRSPAWEQPSQFDDTRSRGPIFPEYSSRWPPGGEPQARDGNH